MKKLLKMGFHKSVVFKTHYKTYKNRQELIKAFKRHYPTYEIKNDTPVFYK